MITLISASFPLTKDYDSVIIQVGARESGRFLRTFFVVSGVLRKGKKELEKRRKGDSCE